MQSINGIGTTLYGKREVNFLDNSYIATKWFIVFFLPIYPLESYRVINVKRKFFSRQPATYQMTKVSLHKKQIINTYLAVWGTLIVLIIIFSIWLSYQN